MLHVLAKQASDGFLPEGLYNNMTFRGAKNAGHSVKSEVGVLAMLLGVGIKDERDNRGAGFKGDSDEEDGIDYLETDKNEEVSGSSY